MSEESNDQQPMRKTAKDKLAHSTEIWNGKTYETDKIPNGFMLDYERIFAPFREQAVRVLEIGVYKGGSCKLWSDFFPHPQSKIIGLDLILPQGDAPADIESRIVLKQCDQNDTNGLKAIAEHFGPFDIIIDDGSHRYDETLNCIQVLFEHVRPGGYYVIEDWGVGYWKDQQHIFGSTNGNTMVTLITSLMQSIPNVPIAGYEIILDIHKSLAFFKKGAPWQS
jgi:cephalosporin hydroxylase